MNVEEFMPDDLDVQKAVVESLAADKIEQNEKIETLRNENNQLKTEKGQLRGEILALQEKIKELSDRFIKFGDVLTKNSESECSNQIALIDRNPDLNDRFQGETRDHVIEVIKEAHDAAEKDGRIRRAQILESVLIANEPSGNLVAKRTELEKLFTDNGNILSGLVISELQKLGIAHKKGEEYLLPSEIIKRTY